MRIWSTSVFSRINSRKKNHECPEGARVIFSSEFILLKTRVLRICMNLWVKLMISLKVTCFLPVLSSSFVVCFISKRTFWLSSWREFYRYLDKNIKKAKYRQNEIKSTNSNCLQIYSCRSARLLVIKHQNQVRR